MDFLKVLFENGAITWDQFVAGIQEKGFKVADLSSGNYVSKSKFDDTVSGKDSTIAELRGQITKRDTDIAALNNQLSAAGDDKAKIDTLTQQVQKWQTDYANADKEFKAKLKNQQYEFAVKEFANGQKFTSNAAQKQFVSEMIQKGLKFENDKIEGADDFLKAYKEANADSFVVEPTPPAPENPPVPFFGQPTPPQPAPAEENAFISMFNFAGVRPHDTNK